MENKFDVRELATNAIRNKMKIANYSATETSEALRAAFIDLNGGSKEINPKTFYRGTKLFALVEELLPAIVEEGFNASNNPIFDLVDYRNISFGDLNEFYLDSPANFVVADAAAGVAGVRRQRLPGGQSVAVPTSFKMVRVYETLGRLLAGRISFDKFVDGVAESFNKQILADIYSAVTGLTSSTVGLGAEYVKSGAYSESDLLTLVQHVEAATGKTARIYGTKAALRKVVTANSSASDAKNDLYNIGFYGKFNGTDMIQLRQAHVPGTNDFAANDTVLFVLAGDDTPIKVVNEGTGLLGEKDAFANADLTQEYMYGQMYGVGVVAAEKFGLYTISG